MIPTIPPTADELLAEIDRARDEEFWGKESHLRTILRAAADLLESEGWCPRLGDNVHEGPYCAVEATTEACDRGVAPWSFQTPALDVLRRHVGSPILAEWNDAQPGPEPVIAALRAAADEAEAS